MTKHMTFDASATMTTDDMMAALKGVQILPDIPGGLDDSVLRKAAKDGFEGLNVYIHQLPREELDSERSFFTRYGDDVLSYSCGPLAMRYRRIGDEVYYRHTSQMDVVIQLV